MTEATLHALLDTVQDSGRRTLIEPEGVAVLRAIGIATPATIDAAADHSIDPVRLASLPGSRVVVKVISPSILHKSDVGGVAIVDKSADAVEAAIARMHAAVGSGDIVGYSVSEFVPYPAALGHELILGLRWTDDVGPVVSVGAGGIYTEFLSAHFRTGHDVVVFAPGLTTRRMILEGLSEVAVVQLMTRVLRGQPPRLDLARLADVVEQFLLLATVAGSRLAEVEVNPLVITPDGRLVALDVLATLRDPGATVVAAPRPLAKLHQLLEPRRVAIMGVSERLNPGHIIVNNLIREGFPREAITIIKPGSATIEGCGCVPDIASMPEPVDLFVLAIDAAQASSALVSIIETRAAEGVVLIPGGLEEKSGSDALVGPIHDALAASRRTDWQGPVINGGNCLGIRSMPGHYDTTFIPEYKFPVPTGAVSPVALVSQSGAFALSRTNKLRVLNPRYAITLGNQMDLTVGDYLTWLQDDPAIEVFAVYVEGFRPLDGRRFLEAASRIVARGRSVILYRAGRTPDGARASASHTASIAGDYSVMRSLCRARGITVAESLEDFEDLTLLFTFLGQKRVTGWRLGAVSNAGFECVAVADNLGRFTLDPLGADTTRTLAAVLAANRVSQVVDLHNPIDLTPMTGDSGYGDTIEALLNAPETDAVFVGCVPFSAAVQTLPASAAYKEDLRASSSVVQRIAGLARHATKPWVVVVDAGAEYDPMVRTLLAAGIPTFRAADRALRLLNVYCATRFVASSAGADR